MANKGEKKHRRHRIVTHQEQIESVQSTLPDKVVQFPSVNGHLEKRKKVSYITLARRPRCTNIKRRYVGYCGENSRPTTHSSYGSE